MDFRALRSMLAKKRFLCEHAGHLRTVSIQMPPMLVRRALPLEIA
jgi:hypothetical protein